MLDAENSILRTNKKIDNALLKKIDNAIINKS